MHSQALAFSQTAHANIHHISGQTPYNMSRLKISVRFMKSVCKAKELHKYDGILLSSVSKIYNLNVQHNMLTLQ